MFARSKSFLFVMLVAVLLLVAAGCGNNNQSASNETASPSAADTTQAAATTDSEFPKTIKHGLGEATIQKKPQRIVVISHLMMEDHLLALGIKPAGILDYAGWTADNSYPYPYMYEQIKDIPTVGTYDNPNLESILSLKPDLIIGLKGYADKAYEQLNQIAPTVMFDLDTMNGDWRQLFLAIGDAVGEKAKAQQFLDDYDVKSKSYAEEIKKLAGDKGMAILFYADDNGGIRLQGTINHALNDMIYKEIGMKPANGVPTDKIMEMISLEQLSSMNPEMIMISDSGSTLDETMKTEVWKRLTAVKEGRVYQATTNWNFWGPQGRLEVFKDIQGLMSK